MKCYDCINLGVYGENIVCGMCNDITGDMEDCKDYVPDEELK